MPLSSKTIDNFKQALDAVVQEAGNASQYKHLVDSLTGVQRALPAGDSADAAKPGEPADSADDQFAAAESAHKAATATKNAERADAVAAAESAAEGEGK